MTESAEYWEQVMKKETNQEDTIHYRGKEKAPPIKERIQQVRNEIYKPQIMVHIKNITIFIALMVIGSKIGTWINSHAFEPEKNQKGDSFEINLPFARKPVVEMKWDHSNQFFANEISKLDHPVVFKNAPSQHWAANRLWTPEYFQEKIPVFRGVQKHSNPVFTYYHGDHPMSNLEFITEDYIYSTYEKVDMNSPEFFEKITKTPPYFYFADSVSNFEAVYKDLAPLEPLMVRNKSWTPEKSYQFRWTNLWIGPAGVTTHTHYDIAHNFYAQISGFKRFVLFPPEMAQQLKLYPFLHPGAQQAQILLEKLPSEIQAEEVVLGPGDVLYNPPLWFHHVSAVTQSMSISVWTPSDEIDSAYATVRSPLPLKRTWSKQTLIKVGALFAFEVLEQVLSLNDMKIPPLKPFAKQPVEFVAELIEARYSLLARRLPQMQAPSTSFCKKSSKSTPTPEQPEENEPEVSREWVVREVGEFWYDSVANELTLFAQIPPRRRLIWLGNFVEQVALTVAGLDHVYIFLRDFADCIQSFDK